MVVVECEHSSIYMDGRFHKQLIQHIIPDLQKRDKDFVLCIDGRERCLVGETLIKTSKGNKRLKDVAGKSIIVSSYDFKKKEVVDGKAVVIPSGRKEVYEVTTSDGKKVQSTLNHTFFVKRGNKILELELKKIKEGDELVCS